MIIKNAKKGLNYERCNNGLNEVANNMEECSLPYTSESGDSKGIFAVCGLTSHSATTLCTFAQIILTLSSSLFIYTYLPHTIINSILIYLSIFCCCIATVFLLLRIWERLFGSMCDSFFHGYLLSIVYAVHKINLEYFLDLERNLCLLMALISFFEVMYFPLSLVQTFTSWSSSSICYHIVVAIFPT
ncbi:hypothetical protein LOAG_13102 [Loa loa]|uniref:Uncharacterized protein n=1 Tax=Loa loa TaxID=7209 RepID=A0A1S0TK34_LOALO|nr:hypothetical protein LOAG_13102 [Loa loa]EFO15408.1 hypothetical protein LOAG_13102 [Loa loa]